MASNKSKAIKAKRIVIGVIIVLDLLIVPWLLQFPRFAISNLSTAPNDWFKFGIFKSIKMIFADSRYRELYLFLQIPVAALIVGVSWEAGKLKKKNKIKDGIGGPEPAGDGQFGTSRWQTDAERDKTTKVWNSNEPLTKGGIIFGKDDDKAAEKIWLDDDDKHTLIIGATRSGKSRKVILPSIWELAKSGESMILGDPKGELYISTKEMLEKEGYNVIALNLREPLKGNQWNMLDLVNKAVDEGNIAKASEYAWSIANTICNQTPSTSSEPIWKNGEQSTIAALALLSSLDSQFKFQRHMTTAYYLLAEYGQPLEDETIPLLEYFKQLPVRHAAKSAFATANIAPYKTRASFFTSALADLRLFSDPTISDMTSKQDHDLEKIGIEKTAVFLIIPDEDKTRNVLATIYIDQVYQILVGLANKMGGRIPRRVNIILDEFGNLPPISDFDSKLTVAAGRGIRFCIAVQDVTQIKKLYDKNAQTITGNCHNWIYIKTADPETAKVVSEKTGKYTVETDNISSSVQNKGHSSTQGISYTGRALLMPDEILRWDNSNTLVMPIDYFPVYYPAPDLSQYKANIEFGFSATGNVEIDKKENTEIIKKRWENIKARDLEETSIWLPEMAMDDEDEEPNEENMSENIQISDNVDSEIQKVSIDEFNIEDILSNIKPSEDSKEEEDSFL